MRIKAIELYQFNELDEKAKEKAREWWRRASEYDDNFWSECVIDDAKEVLKLLGFEIKNIYWSGFWSQGDGACFVGSWSAKGLDLKSFEEAYPEDESNKEIRALALEFDALAREFPEATASFKHNDRYSHEHSVDIECEGFEKERYEEERGDVPVACETDESNFKEFCRDCMRWIYKSLEKAYEWSNADEQVDENIIANEYEFTKEGERA